MVSPSSSFRNPPLAIITPYRNALIFCHQYVDMLSNQSFSDWQCFLIDDHSTDGSYELLLDLTNNDQRFTHLSVKEPHAPGPFYARNIGLDSCIQDYICFCDIDDIWHPNKLEQQFSHHLKHNLDITVTSYYRMVSLALGRHTHITPPKQLSYTDLLRSNFIPLSTVLLSRKFLRGYRFSDVRHEDYLLWLELFRTTRVRYSLINQTLVVYRVHPNNLTRHRYLMPLWIFSVYYRIYPNMPFAFLLTLRSLAFKGYLYLSSTFSSKWISLDQFLLSPPA
jgi:teichuronic acid biosynthesis glycosyltransferase TuaG